MFNRIRRMTATCHSGHAAQASESAAVPLARRIRVDADLASCREPRNKASERAVLSLASGPKHNGAAFMAYRGSPQGSARGDLHALDCRDHHRMMIPTIKRMEVPPCRPL